MKKQKSLLILASVSLTLAVLSALCLAKSSPFAVTAGGGIGYPGVAELTIYSDPSYDVAGHAFMSVLNMSNSSIVVGKMSVPSGGGIAIGTWPANYIESGATHKGVYYNRENRIQNVGGGFSSSLYSMSMPLTSAQLYTVTTYINSYNDTWEVFDNCSDFAKNTWNSVSSVTLSNGTNHLPMDLAMDIYAAVGYLTNPTIPYDARRGFYVGNTFTSY